MISRKLFTGLNFVILLTCLPVFLFSQNLSDTTVMPGSAQTQSSYFTPKKTNFGVQLGSQFTSFSGGSAFSTYLSPHMTYAVSKRFSLSGGVSIINTYLNGKYPSYYGETILNGSTTSALVYLSGQYILSDRLTIEGTAYKQFSILSDFPGSKAYNNNDLQGMYMNVKYKVRDNFQIEAGFGYSRGYNPFNNYYSDPFNHSFTDPFFHPIH